MRKVIITVALTGGFHGKEANPNLPEQPDEIAADAYACYNEGAAVAHIHARDRQGKNTGDVEVFRDIKNRVRDRCDIVTSFSTGGGVGMSTQQRIQSAYADPDLCSLNMGSFVRPDGTVWSNTTAQLEEWAGVLKERNIKPELEVYSHPMFLEVENLISKGLLEKPYFINLVLGMKRQGALPATTKNLLSLVDYFPLDCILNTTIVGKMQLQLTTLGLLLGGNIRVGLEDNIYYGKNDLATNARLVARSVKIVRDLGFEVATAKDAREILGLRKDE
ncbi:MAG: 3-keto-5-aminohexanoate cleavage protein [Deltaproteobacteria bacterium HGW-Deltaproteobacteria-21]|nr:MAG: 3-keto-5-aminohexanoate cleavage protein [Deltaproteobacteria bacterium HGW-Deltaproteobacteria-21]